MSRTRAERRHLNLTKALRKRDIVRHCYYWASEDKPVEYYDNLHQYSKNKIHCSCPICSNKTNHYLFGKHNYRKSDLVKIERLNQELLWLET